MVITMAVTAAIFTLMHPAQGMFSLTEVSDMQQRLRVGWMRSQDLLMAGAGTYSPRVGPGPLVNFFAPILPARVGRITPDPPGSFMTDRLTVMYVPHTPSQTTLSQEHGGDHPHLHVNQIPGCPLRRDVCGFDEGTHLVIFDGAGRYDTFVATGDGGDGGRQIAKKGHAPSTRYPEGAYVSQLVTRTYYLSMDTREERYQLRQYDGFDVDVPIVDNVVGLEFELYGETQPAQIRTSVTDPLGPWTTYGPKPPALEVDNPNDTWPAGEDCAFLLVAGEVRPRMEALGDRVDLGEARQSHADRRSMVSDRPAAIGRRGPVESPWVASASASGSKRGLRGPAGPLFARGGLRRWREIHSDYSPSMSPRNLNLGR